MDRGPAMSSDSLPLAEALKLNAECERFESDWRAGLDPRIETRLHGFAEPARSALLNELLALEVELRRERGDQPTPAEYTFRFEDASAAIALLFARQTDTARPGSTSPTRLADQPVIGRRIGDYEIIEELARGGMGIVYKARQSNLGDRLVALKMIRAGTFATEADVQRFVLEAEAAASLDHPNIVPIFQIGRHQGQPFYSMRLVGGGTLREKVFDFRDDPRAAARLLVPIARALQYAHERLFVHRDLKPANILIDAHGEPVLTDFGLAKRLNEDGRLTQTGTIIGTPSYMSPEQAAGRSRAVTGRSDVYGLGAVLYELLVGHPPFDAETMMETIIQVIERDPLPPSQLRPGVPRDLELICLKCLDKRPEGRYATAGALADDLDRYLRGEPVEARQSDLPGRVRRWFRRRPELAARLVGLSIILILAQANYVAGYLRGDPLNRVSHLGISIALLLWAIASIACALIGKSPRWANRVRFAWIGADVIALTAGLAVLDAAATPLVVGYPIVIAAAALWSRVRLVACSTLLSIVGFILITYTRPIAADEHPNIVVAALAVTGLIVGYQVRRLQALSRYCEQRRPAD